jgi:hypothetical protein
VVDADDRNTDMTERARFYFGPICPWCYQTSRWVRRLDELGVVELEWGLFSLEAQNAGAEPEELAAAHARSAPALRRAGAARDAAGHAGVGAFYGAVGQRVHERGEALEEPATVEGALADESTIDRVAAEHRELCERTRSFGVPTIVLDGGDGPAIFGPVITDVPDDDDAEELWRHVSWLVRHESFAELKRDRVSAPDLESVRQWQRARAAEQDDAA